MSINSTISAIDYRWMALALELAERGRFTTRPNPCVGCVIADGETLIGQGYHQRAGEPHAEVFALREAGEKARGATAYVTLEPCAHFGRTPPCADALIAAGVSKVVIAAGDPFAQVAGKGIEKLRAAGITVVTDVLGNPARVSNRGFFSRIEKSRPWITLKLACSLDGKTALANGASQWISGPESRADVQRLRAQSCAIVTGIGTVLADNPRLNLRDPQFANVAEPLKVVIDRRLRTPVNSQLMQHPERLLIAHCSAHAETSRLSCQLFELPDDPLLQLPALFTELAKRQINQVLVEAGPHLAGALLQQGLLDEIVLYQAPMFLGDAGRDAFAGIKLDALDSAFRFQVIEQRRIGSDTRLILQPNTTHNTINS
jgi:diaminohydroxyphosphoribosylaminopyrimidine deaminase / 5-amino-6-(5-phosphoribosylamino)uracil reductase